MPAVPQSEIGATFLACQFQKTGEKCGEIVVHIFTDFRPFISREDGRKEFHANSSTQQDPQNFTGLAPKVLHWDTLGESCLQNA